MSPPSPPSLLACLRSAVFSRASVWRDRYILTASRNAALSYVGVYLAACGIYPNIPNTIAWVSNNVEGSYKCSVTLAMVISFGNINGAVSSNVYRGQNKPWYRLGHGIVLMYMYIAIAIVCASAYRMLLKRENERRDRGERDEVIVGVNKDRKELLMNSRLTSVERNQGLTPFNPNSEEFYMDTEEEH
ncbi:hypothetical protein BDW22DRAFT_1431502 [Trametopsis cervina]|nr:hypothetical protein BDW22DRAFT_1431502 [Trametopsis cervina]